MSVLVPSLSRRRLLQLGAFGGAAALLAGCGGGGGSSPGGSASSGGTYTPPDKNATGTLTISNWGDPGDDQVYASAKKRFQAAFPNVQVTDNFVPITTWTDYINKLVADVAAGNAPDVINIAIEGMALGVSKQLFTPLDDYVARDATAKDILDNTGERLLDGLTFEDKLYFLPNTWNTMLIYYNTKLFSDAGVAPPTDDWTWDTFLDTAKKLTKGSGGSKQYGFSLPYFNFGLSPWFFSNGTSEFSADLATATFTDPKMVDAVTFIRDLVTEHGVAPQPKGADPYALFKSEQAAMTGAGHWLVGGYKKDGFTNWDVVSWPQKEKKATVYGVSGFGIYSKAKSPDLAWEYCKVLAGKETQDEWAAKGAANPARESAALSKEFASFPKNASLFYKAIDYAQPVQAPVVFPVADTALMRSLDTVMNGSVSPADALKAVQDEVAAEM